jgi:carbon dioxide concentrating mechanism protein CcmO
LQIEINDMLGTSIKFAGSPADIAAAVEAGKAVAAAMQVECVSSIINAPAEQARPAYNAPPEFSPLIEQNLVHFPQPKKEDTIMSNEMPFAIGMIETQGFTAVFEAIDTACKAANVEVIGREKLGGGYITVLLKGDVAAVKAAVEAGVAKVDGLGKLIAGHVIPRPSQAVLSLLPKIG